MFRRRRPLLRAAAVGGGAYALGSHHARGQQREAEQDQQIQELQSQAPVAAAPPAPVSAGISSDAVEKLQQLAKLHEQGVLTDEEFTVQKQRLLA
jgi:Short C-terminal domain